MGRLLKVGASLALVWAMTALWIAPTMIEQGYQGRSLDLINDAFGGRDQHSLERYLEAWYALARSVTLVGVASFSLAGLLIGFSAQRRKLLRNVIWSDPEIDGATLFWFGALAGFVTGLAEALTTWLRYAVTQRPAVHYYGELLWLSPLSAMAATIFLVAAMLIVARLANANWGVGRASAVFVFCAAYALLRQDGVGLHWISAFVLALGLGTLVAKATASHATGFLRGLRVSRAVLPLLVISCAAWSWWLLPDEIERRSIEGRAAAEAGRPNLIVIIWDTVRAASLDLYGYERETAPNLSEWARSGVVFDAAIATSSWTLPTHGAVFTGHYNFTLETGYTRPLDSRYPTLAEVLTEHGYVAGGFTANRAYGRETSGLDRGFDRWEDHPMVGAALFLDSSWLSRTLRNAVSGATGIGVSGYDKSAATITEEFLDWASDRERPFFAFLNVFDAHAPYESPASQARYLPLPTGTWWEFYAAWQSEPGTSYTKEAAQAWVNQYDNAIRYIDQELGRMRRTLEERGLLDNTIVVVTSDHGESWGEHGQLEHGTSLYIETLHVPLMIWYPTSVPGGVRVQETVSLTDLPTTLLELVGIDPGGLAGGSLSRFWLPGNVHARSPALAELQYEPIDSRPWHRVSLGDMESLVTDDLHYVLNGDGTQELYRWREDPAEEVDLVTLGASAEILDSLRAALDSIKTGRY